MSNRENSLLEASKYLTNVKKASAKKAKNIKKKAEKEKEKFVDKYHKILDGREKKLREHTILVEDTKDAMLGTALKAIYITALEANTLTDEGIDLAENLVDTYIKECGGATAIFNNQARNKTYLLSRLQQIVEDATDDEVKEIESDPDAAKEDKTEDKDDKDTKKNDNDNKEDNSTDTNNDDSEDKEISYDNYRADGDDFEDDGDLDDDGVDDVSDSDTDDLPLDSDPDNDDTEAADDMIDNMDQEDLSIDGDSESHGKIFDELEDEEDIRKAVKLIRQRVADAEETFIKNNAEDKKAIDDLLSKISNSIKTVEDLDDEDSPESQIAQESARTNRRKMQNITDNRPLTVLERMTRGLMASIVKDDSLKERYVTESGSIDTGNIFESAKLLYGFMETLNTLQLDKIDEAYIEEVLNNL